MVNGNTEIESRVVKYMQNKLIKLKQTFWSILTFVYFLW